MRQPPILMYHWFRPDGSVSASRSPQLEITPRLFERQMRHLSRLGYTTVSLADALDRPPAPRQVVLTVDDGTLDFWTWGLPVLARHGFTATLFVVTGHVDGESTWDRALGEPPRRLMSWSQIRELHAAGFEIGSHTHSHRVLTELGDEEAVSELTKSREILAERLGSAPGFVAYPRGFHAERHKRMAREAGYAGACAVILAWRDLRRADAYGLKRMTVKGDEGLARFRARLGVSRWVPYVRTSEP